MLSSQLKLSLSYYSDLYDMIVPKDHILRKIRELVDFSFIYDELKNKYCLDNGRNAKNPILLFKYLLLKYLYNLSAFWKAYVVLSLIFSLRSCNTLDRQAPYRCCHDIIHAWKNLNLKTFASPFPVLDLHTQKEYLQSIFRLVSDLLLQISICIPLEQTCAVLSGLGQSLVISNIH